MKAPTGSSTKDRQGHPGKKPAQGRPKRRLLSGDRVLTLLGFAVAGCAALLPWYAVVGGHGLGIRNDGLLRLSGHKDEMAGYGVNGSIRPFGAQADVARASGDFADLSTGAIPEIQHGIERAKRNDKPQDQPFPGRAFRVVHIVNGQALIADNGGMYLVGVGSRLPDNSTLKSFTEKDGRWAVVTSEGEVIAP